MKIYAFAQIPRRSSVLRDGLAAAVASLAICAAGPKSGLLDDLIQPFHRVLNFLPIVSGTDYAVENIQRAAQFRSEVFFQNTADRVFLFDATL